MLEFLRRNMGGRKMNKNIQLVSIHIPKTAGTSFRNTLKSIYGEEAVVRVDIEKTGEHIRVNQEDYAENRLPPHTRVVHGHFRPTHLYAYFPIPEEVPIITWLRDPVERVISNYYYLARRLAEELDEERKGLNILSKMQRTLIEYARDENNQNRMKKFLRGVTLEELTFVGIQEYYSEDLAVLAELFGWASVPEFKDNVTTRKYDVSSADRAEIAALNADDVALYQRALERRKR